jgi:hypothetical protein
MTDSLQKVSQKKRIDNLGDFAGNSPGRPKGSKNRFTALKQDLADESIGQKVKAEFDAALTSNNQRTRFEAVKLFFTLFPREDKLQHEIAQLVMNKTVVHTTCNVCGHNPETCSDTPTNKPNTAPKNTGDDGVNYDS